MSVFGGVKRTSRFSDFMPASDLKRPFKAVGKTLRCERETAACAAEHELLGHLLLGEIDEILSAAMHRHDKSHIELLQFGHHLCQIITVG